MCFFKFKDKEYVLSKKLGGFTGMKFVKFALVAGLVLGTGYWVRRW